VRHVLSLRHHVWRAESGSTLRSPRLRAQIDGGNAVILHGADVFRIVAHRQQPAVDFGVQGLGAAVNHFRKPGHVG
jgi:hypothetical protein